MGQAGATEHAAGTDAPPNASGLSTVAPPEPSDAFDDVDDVETGDPDVEAADELPEPEQPTRQLSERQCRTKTCLKLFRPTHVAQHYCPACRGLRVPPATSGHGQTNSWWLNTTSRDDFQKRAAGREEDMRTSTERSKVPNRILGERSS